MKSGALQLLPAGHSIRLRHHRHTSYASLLFILLVTGVLLLGVSFSTSAATVVNPQQGSVGLGGSVPGPPPTTAPVILSPRGGSSTSSLPITVSGTCPAGDYVELSKNGVFSGAVNCADDGTFSLLSDLLEGQNALVARAADALGQFGPDSAAVNVFYNAPTFNFNNGAGVGRQLFLQTQTPVVGVDPGVNLNRTVTIVGGEPPYAVVWDWGDGATTTSAQPSDGAITATHSYDRPGNYRVIVRVTDAASNSALLQLVTVVNGPVTSAATSTNRNSGSSVPGNLIAVWPLFAIACLMVLLFWLGERREVDKLEHQGRLSPAI